MTRLFPPAILAFALMSVPADASVSIGGTFARACYEAADAHNSNYHAIKSCDRALTEEKLNPQDRAATLVNRGILRLERGHLSGAEADFNAALAIDSREPEAWLNLAILKTELEKSPEALPHIDKALAYGTRRPAVAYFVRAMADEDAGRISDAYRDLQRANRLDPTWPEPAIELKRFQVRRP